MISPVSAPQRGHSPSSTRSGRSCSLSSASIWPTISFVNVPISSMNPPRSPLPCSMSESFFYHEPVSSGDVILCSSSIVITCSPFGVG